MNNESTPNNNDNLLPEVIENTLPSIGNILNSFGLPRNIIASNDEIAYAWNELPREITRIPPELRDGLIARMCVATSVGLFDGAINYVWNAVVLNLRIRAVRFGLGYISQILNKKFEEDDLKELTDSELLNLCYKLELLSEEGYYFLNQCRDIRNNFSSAHPSIAQIDDRELINFISRCCKHGISSDYTFQGINIADFVDAIKADKFSQDTLETWCELLENTFPAQRALLIPMLHGLYCDPDSKEHTRINALSLCLKVKPLFDSKIESAFINQHNNYVSKGDEKRTKASRVFFQKTDLINLLTNAEKHAIVRNACESLFRVHQGFDNFYNEPPFAKNLSDIVKTTSVPDSAKEEYVQTVVTCYTGNPYGVSRAAVRYYSDMIENFSPKEIGLMLKIPSTNTIVSDRIKTHFECKKRFLRAFDLIDENSFTTSQKEKLISLKKKLIL